MEGTEMLVGADRTMTTTAARPTQVVDVNDWLERATDPSRAFTPTICEYVPRHRAEAASES
jgi:hypothetical protein